jgi:predicted dehydrogenase
VSKKSVILIGFGNQGHEWFHSIHQHPDWELIGIVDSNTELLGHVPTINIGIGEDQVFPSIEDAVRYGQKPDLAIVAVPIYYHHLITKSVLDLDINVICEKNMATTIYQGRQMVQLAKDKPHLCTAVGTQYRYQTRYNTAYMFFRQENVPIGPLGIIKWESHDFRGEVLKPWWFAQQDVYLEDMSIHWFDMIRYISGMDIVQVKADVFMPRYTTRWQGSTEVHALLALACPEDYENRHEWVFCDFYGGFQRGGSTFNDFEFFGRDGQVKIEDFGMAIKTYTDPTRVDLGKFEEDAYLASDAGPVIEGTTFTGQEAILDHMSKAIDAGAGKHQPPTNFREAFKSFAVTMAAQESSRTGKTVWVPDYWAGLLD